MQLVLLVAVISVVFCLFVVCCCCFSWGVLMLTWVHACVCVCVCVSVRVCVCVCVCVTITAAQLPRPRMFCTNCRGERNYFGGKFVDSSVQFKLVSMCLEKPICAPPHLSEVSPMSSLKWFQCSSDWWWPSFILSKKMLFDKVSQWFLFSYRHGSFYVSCDLVTLVHFLQAPNSLT